jgi:hypothetical protein
LRELSSCDVGLSARYVLHESKDAFRYERKGTYHLATHAHNIIIYRIFNIKNYTMPKHHSSLAMHQQHSLNQPKDKIYRNPHHPIHTHLEHSPPILQARHNHGPILHRRTIPPIVLHHKIHRKTQLATPLPRHRLSKRPTNNLRIIDNTRHIVPPAHKSLILSGLATDILGEDFHHVFFGIGGLVVTPVAVLRDI